MPLPLLSVIIPTHKRPQFLPRAIDSALLAAPNGDVEVIVVPNGPDTSWQEIEKRYKDEPRIIWSAIETAHANAARNHGLELAKGKYIRFLDDDDYFYPENAQEQLLWHIDQSLDVSYGVIYSTFSEDNIVLHKHKGPLTKDYVFFVSLPLPSTPQGGGFLYHNAVVKDLWWDINIHKRQDLYWSFSIAAKQEVNFSRFEGAVGAWVQHSGKRVSKGHPINEYSKETVKQILLLYESLKQQNRLSAQRKYALSSRLWHCVHDCLMIEPKYWIEVSRMARKISRKGKPGTPIYKYWPYVLNPLFWELMLIPIRKIKIALGHVYHG